MQQNAYLLVKIVADTGENDRNFAEILPNIGNYTLRVHYPTSSATSVRSSAWDVRVRAESVPGYRYAGNPTFGRSVLGCIEADVCNLRHTPQHSSSSTRLARFCTAPNSKFAVFFRKILVNFQDCVKIWWNFVKTQLLIFFVEIFTEF